MKDARGFGRFVCREYLPSTLTILTPPIETPDPPNDIPGASKQVVLTPHDIPRILRVIPGKHRKVPFFVRNLDGWF